MKLAYTICRNGVAIGCAETLPKAKAWARSVATFNGDVEAFAIWHDDEIVATCRHCATRRSVRMEWKEWTKQAAAAVRGDG